MKKCLLLCFLLITCFQTKAELTEIELLTPEEERALELEVINCMSTLFDTGFIDDEKGTLERFCKVKVYTKGKEFSRLSQRLINEKMTELNAFVITPHKMSYILPVTYTDSFNKDPYRFEFFPEYANQMDNYEAKFQISFKMPITTEPLLIPGDGIYFGMTLQAWWQIYANNISKPFRETNYQPEIMYFAPLPFRYNGGSFLFSAHFEHQSNGQTQLLSRSWNRFLLSLTYAKDNYALGIKPWYRFEESEKSNSNDPKGDDNPDIHRYLGYYEIYGAYAFNDDHKVNVSARKNWKTGNGSIEINVTYPMWGRMIGMLQYFSGYGESMIDYNHKQQKIGIGIALTDIF